MLKVCVQEFWLRETTIVYYFFKSIRIYVSVVKASRSEAGDMGSIPAVCWNWIPLEPLSHNVWHQGWLSQSVHWHACFYTAALSIVFFLGLCQWQFRDDRVLTSNFHCFGALGVGPGAWARTRQAWRMEWKNHKSALPFIFLDLSKKNENNGPQWGFFNSHPPRLLCVCKVWPVVKWTQLNWLSTEKWHSVHCFQS